MATAFQYGSGSGSTIRGMNMTLIWTNTDPTSSFAAQTVAVDWAGYDAVFIRTMFSASTQTVQPMSFHICDKTTTAFISITARTNNQNGGRLFTFDDTGIIFQGGYYNGSATNNYAIPYQIYGVKFR